jgi:glycosyltransferase involved in cell wall biosynthesis
VRPHAPTDKPHVAIVYPVPVPYSFPVLERITSAPDLDTTVYYCRRALSARGAAVPSEQLRFPHVFLRNLGFVAVGREVRELDFNPSLPLALERGRHALVALSGFVQPTMLLGVAWARARRRPYALMSESHGLRARGRVRAAVRDALVRRLVTNAALLLPTGELAERELVRLGAREGAVARFPHVPDHATFHPRDRHEAREVWARRLGRSPDLLVVYVGRLVASKRVDVLLRAFAEVALPNAQLVIAGEGPLAEQLRADAPPNVTFAGFLPTAETALLLRAADVAVVPSSDEPWGAVVLEAVASGTPVLATDVVASAREVAAYGGACLTPVGDVRALAEALRAATDADTLASLRRGATAAAAAFTVDGAADSFLNAVRATLERDARAELAGRSRVSS